MLTLISWSRPEARDQIIHKMDWNDFTLLRKLSNDTISINWPFSPSKAVIVQSDDEVTLSDDFVDHVRDLKNWSVGASIAEAFPFLRCIPVRN